MLPVGQVMIKSIDLPPSCYDRCMLPETYGEVLMLDKYRVGPRARSGYRVQRLLSPRDGHSKFRIPLAVTWLAAAAGPS